MTGDYFTAEDITQDTFISAYNHWQKFDGTNEKAWICRIATNKCIDYKRAAARNVIALQDEMIESIPDTAEPLRELLNKEILEEFENAVKSLEEPYKSISQKHFVEGKTAREISVETDVGLKTIQTQIYRARNMLKKSLEGRALLHE